MAFLALVGVALEACAPGPALLYGAPVMTADQERTHSVLTWADPHSVIVWNGGGVAGMPILIKDNIETRDMPTTAGSLALERNAPGRDATLVARLRNAGAVILGKTNMSEWANMRSPRSFAGWSAVGGQTLNAFDPTRTPCGSSSGSAVAVAIGLAPAAIGTETDGSITCPASVNGVVGFKPTTGLVSRTHIVPVSQSQDSPGPIARSVRDAADILTVIAGSDPTDPATAAADQHKTDYGRALDAHALRGARIGVLRFVLPRYSAGARAAFEEALHRMRDAGAILVDIDAAPAGLDEIGGPEYEVLLSEFRTGLNVYLATTRIDQVQARSLLEIIAFNNHEPRETPFFGQEVMEQAETTASLDPSLARAARERSFQAAGPNGIDLMLKQADVVALVAPTTSRAATLDRDDEDRMQGSVSQWPAVAGYPHLTVPMGWDRGLPVGLSFIGSQWSDAQILSLGYSLETFGPSN
jgi:amidase